MNAPVTSGGSVGNAHTGAPERASRAYRCPSPDPKYAAAIVEQGRRVDDLARGNLPAQSPVREMA
jgi:hypothetical protein